MQRSEEGRSAALILIMQAIPCIMHFENRVGEKILTMLLAIRAELFQQRRVGASLKMYVAEVGQIASRAILGSQWRPAQWKVLMKENGEELAKVSLRNTKTRTFMNALDTLINFIFQHPEVLGLHNDWLQLMEYYNPCIEMLQKPAKFTDDEIEEFQSLTDSFYEKWIELVGVDF